MLTVTAGDGSNADWVQIMVTNTPDPVLILPDTGEWRGLWSESGHLVGGLEGPVDGTDVIVRFSIAPFVGPAY